MAETRRDGDTTVIRSGQLSFMAFSTDLVRQLKTLAGINSRFMFGSGE